MKGIKKGSNYFLIPNLKLIEISEVGDVCRYFSPANTQGDIRKNDLELMISNGQARRV